MMKVQKRNGSFENVSFDKIQTRLLTLCQEPNLKPLNIDPTIVAQKVCSEIYDGVTTEDWIFFHQKLVFHYIQKM